MPLNNNGKIPVGSQTSKKLLTGEVMSKKPFSSFTALLYLLEIQSTKHCARLCKYQDEGQLLRKPFLSFPSLGHTNKAYQAWQAEVLTTIPDLTLTPISLVTFPSSPMLSPLWLIDCLRRFRCTKQWKQQAILHGYALFTGWTKEARDQPRA